MHVCVLSCVCGLWPTKLLCPWDFPGKNTGVCHCLLQVIFPTQGCLLWLWICRRILYDRATQEAHRNGRLYPSGSGRKDTSWKEGIKTLCPCTLGKHSFPPCYTVKEESENVSMVCSEEPDVLFFLRDICIMKTMGRAGSDLAGITVYIGWILSFIRGHTFLRGSFPVPLN